MELGERTVKVLSSLVGITLTLSSFVSQKIKVGSKAVA